jgi:hypothetical protein
MIEGVNGNSTKIPGASGAGLETALKGYSDWVKNKLLPGFCESYGMSSAAFRLLILGFLPLIRRYPQLFHHNRAH